MILFLILAMVGIIAMFMVMLSIPPLFQLITVYLDEYEREEKQTEDKFTQEEEVLVCPSCETIRDKNPCPKCGAALITFDKYEETW